MKCICCNFPSPFPFLSNLCSRFQAANVYKTLTQYFQKHDLACTTSGALLQKFRFILKRGNWGFGFFNFFLGLLGCFLVVFLFYFIFKYAASSLFVQAQWVVQHFGRDVWSFHLHTWRCFIPWMVFSVTTKDFLGLNTGTDELNPSGMFFIRHRRTGLPGCA